MPWDARRTGEERKCHGAHHADQPDPRKVDDVRHYPQDQRHHRVTSRGKWVLAVMSWDKYDVIRETMSILGDPALMRSLKRSLREARTGSLVPLAKVAKDLG